MPFANNNGVKIYYEVEGHGPPLVLAHGRGGSLQAWRRHGYADVLGKDFQLLLIDSRGHGQSDKPHEPAAYGLLNMADDVVATLDYLGTDRAHYFGYSMGGRIGYWLAARHRERFRSFILGGDAPLSPPDISFQKQIIEMLNLLLNDPQAALFQRERMLGRPMTLEERSAFLANDARALIALAASVADSPQVTTVDLSGIPAPCLVLCGDVDTAYAGAKEAASHIPHARFISLTGLNHSQAFERADLVLPHIKKFLAEVNK